jgi:hypothetical protein
MASYSLCARLFSSSIFGSTEGFGFGLGVGDGDLPVADMEDLELADFLVSVAKLSGLDNCPAVSETGQVYYLIDVEDEEYLCLPLEKVVPFYEASEFADLLG